MNTTSPSEDLLAEIFWSSLSINERRQYIPLSASESAPPREDQVESRLKLWRENVALSSPARFHRRLLVDGISIEQARILLSPETRFQTSVDFVFPAWIQRIDNIHIAFEIPDCEITAEIGQAFRPSEPVPFEECLSALVVQCSRELRRHFEPSCCEMISEAAFSSLQRHLLNCLALQTSKVLQQEFGIFRLKYYDTFDMSMLRLQKEPGTDIYLQFIHQLKSGGFLQLLQTYPLMARFIGQTMEFWLCNSKNLVQRILNDWQNIQIVFPEAAPKPVLENISDSLSDPHCHGQSVLLLEFQNQFKIIYKPHCLDMEDGFYGFLNWFNQHKKVPRFRNVRVLSRPRYGWMEWVPHSPCDTAEQFSTFYVQAGGLLALLYVFSGTDLHHENVIASGANPVLIDLEALFHPSEKGPLPGHSADDLARNRLWDSVLNTGLLPNWILGPDNQLFSLGALGAKAGKLTSFPELAWKKINTDGMHIDARFATIQSGFNTPFCGTETADPSSFAGSIEEGFRAVYGFLSQQKSTLLANGSPLDFFRNCSSRYIFRPTRVYCRALDRLWAPKVLVSGVDWQIEAEHLGRSLYTEDQPGPLWVFLKEELAALINGDVPIFYAPLTSKSIFGSEGGELSPGFPLSSFEQVRKRIFEMNEVECGIQSGFIRHSLQIASALDRSDSGSIPKVAATRKDVSKEEELTSSAFLEKADMIGRQLLKQSIQVENSIAWIGLKNLKQSSMACLEPMPDDFYGGTLGVAWFLAALGRQTAEKSYSRCAILVCESLIAKLKNKLSIQLLAQKWGHGIAGVGGILFALPQLGFILERPDFICAAGQLAEQISQIHPRIESMDFVGGIAGTLAGFCALHGMVGTDSILEKADAFGRLLLAGRKKTKDWDGCSWLSTDGQVITGFAHGSSGICFALLQLHECSPNPIWIDAVGQAVMAENRIFDSFEKNWPDLRPSRFAGKKSFAQNWCAGSAGVLLSRIKFSRHSSDPNCLHDCELAAGATSRSPSQIANLCCGLTGSLDSLMTADSFGIRVDQKAIARKTRDLFERKEPGGTFHPSLFQGDAGIGFQFLRLADSQNVPSILSWESQLGRTSKPAVPIQKDSKQAE